MPGDKRTPPWEKTTWNLINRGQKLYSVREHNNGRRRRNLPPIYPPGFTAADFRAPEVDDVIDDQAVSELTQQSDLSGGGSIADILSPAPPALSFGDRDVPGGPGPRLSTPHTRTGTRYGQQEEEEDAPADLTEHPILDETVPPPEPAPEAPPNERCMQFHLNPGQRIKITIEVL